MNAYEITYIVRPDLDEEQTRAVVEGVSGRIQSVGGELIAALPWNPPRRRMAYPIKEFGDGFYVTTVFRVEPGELKGLENNLKLNDRLLRFLLVQATEMNIKQAQQRLQQQQVAAQRPPVPVEQAPAAQVAAPESTVVSESESASESDPEFEVADPLVSEPASEPEQVVTAENVPAPEAASDAASEPVVVVEKAPVAVSEE